MSLTTKLIAGSLAVAALGATTASAAEAPAGKMVDGKAGVRVVDPANTVEVGAGRNIPVGVKFTDASKNAGVRAVVVKLVRIGGGERVHYGKVIFRPGDGKRQSGALTAKNAGFYWVRYDVLTGADTAGGDRKRVDFRVLATPSS